MELAFKTKNPKQQRKCFVYFLYDIRYPDDIRYIGITSRTLSERLSNHKYDSIKNKVNTHKTNWIKKVLKDGSDVGISIIEECDSFESACKKEIELIDLYIRSGYKLTNTTSGGQGSLSVCSDEKKEKIRKTLTGHKVSEETREKIREKVKAFWDNLCHEKLLEFKSKKKNISTETRKKMSISKKGKQTWLGKKHKEESKVKMSLAKKKRNGNLI